MKLSPTETNLSKPIICGTDFSQGAARAAVVADALARHLDAPLILARSADERGDFPDHLREGLMNADRHKMTEEAERLRGLGLTFTEMLLHGAPGNGIAAFAAREQARLVVVGASGTGALCGSRWVLGNVAERIAETSPVPTLVVHTAEPLVAWARGEHALKVFVAVDFTTTSDAALRWIEEWRQIGPCEITLAHVHLLDKCGERATCDGPSLGELTTQVRQGLEHDLKEKASRILEVVPAIHVELHSARVDAHLVALATEAGADLLVLGTHQWQNLDRVWHSSISRRVLHSAPTNLVCVPTPIAPSGAAAAIPAFHRVLVATDLSERSGHAIPYAYSALPREGATVCLLHVVEPGSLGLEGALEARLRALVPAEAAARGVATEVRVVESRNFGETICEAVERFGADLVCIGSHGASGLTAALMGSVAQAVIAHSPSPVMVVRPPSNAT